MTSLTSPLDLVTKRLAGAGLRVGWSDRDVRQVLARYGAGSTEAGSVMRAVTQAAPVLAAAPAAGGGRTYTFTISTSGVDRMNDTIATSGWRLDAYRRNPVVLWQHDGKSLPVGRSTKVWAEGNRLKATAELATSFTTYAASVAKLIDEGFLRAASVGFRPIKFKFSDDKARPNGIDFLEQELLEWSIVTVPANSDALIDPGQASKSAAAAEVVRLGRLADLAILKARG